MKHTALIFLSFLSLTPIVNANTNSEAVKAALEAQPNCENFVRYDDENIYLGFGRNPEVKIVSIKDSKNVRTLTVGDSALDMARINGTLWILTYSALEEWDLARAERLASYPTYNAERSMKYKEHPTGMAAYKGKLVISHGRWGLSIFDTSKKKLALTMKLVGEQSPRESMATGVAVAGDRAYIVMDSFTLSYPGEKEAFRGVIVYNLQTNLVEDSFDQMDPGADAAVTDGQKLLVSFMGQPIWSYSLAALKGSSTPTPDHRVFQFPIAGHPAGRPDLDDKFYYTCYAKAPASPGGRYQLIPLALDRKAIHLD